MRAGRQGLQDNTVELQSVASSPFTLSNCHGRPSTSAEPQLAETKPAASLLPFHKRKPPPQVPRLTGNKGPSTYLSKPSNQQRARRQGREGEPGPQGLQTDQPPAANSVTRTADLIYHLRQLPQPEASEATYHPPLCGLACCSSMSPWGQTPER